jgi:hypothetical protein
VRRATLACIVVAASGCDNLFGLTELIPPTGHPTADAGPDAGDPPADANVDAPPGLPDEDGDGAPDVTDNCPATPNAGQGDDDMDGLGNACDPNPNTASERPLSFEGFNADVAGLTCNDGVWKVEGGQLVQHDTVVAHLAGMCTFPVQASVPRYTVVTRLHVLGQHATGMTANENRAVGVWVDLAQSTLDKSMPVNGVACEFYRVFDSSTTVPTGFWADVYSGGSQHLGTRYTATEPTIATIVATRDDSLPTEPVTCVEVVQNFNLVTAAPTYSISHFYGVRVANLSVAFDYVWAYETVAP